MNNLLSLIGFSVLLFVPVGAPNTFAQLSGIEGETTSFTPTVLTNVANAGEIVYENGNPSGSATSFFLHINSVAQDFILDNPASITDVHFILIERDSEIPTTFDGVIQYAILADNSGPDPNNVLGSGTAINLETQFIETIPLPRDRILVWFDLESPVPLDAGVTYWLWLHAGDDYVDDERLGWEVNDQIINECTRFYSGEDFTGTPFIQCAFDTWFQLTAKHDVVGGKFLQIDSTALILSGILSNSVWMIPIVISGLGIGLFLFRKSNIS